MSVLACGSVDELPGSVRSGLASSPHTTLHRLRLLEHDRRYQSSYLHVGDEAGGVALQLSVPRVSEVAETRGVGARDGVPRDARELLMIGVRAELRSLALASPGLPASLTASYLRQLLAAAAARAYAKGRVALVPYAQVGSPLRDAALALGGRVTAERDPRFIFEDVGANWESFVGSLPASRRQLLRRDRRSLDAIGWETEEHSWEEVLPWASTAVETVIKRHVNGSTHAMTAFRLRQLVQDPDADRVAFVGRSSTGGRVVSLAWRYSDTVELYELGLEDVQRGRDEQDLYLAGLIHAPLDHMWREGLRRLDLATLAERPKRVRGASPLAVAELRLAPP